MINRRMDDLGRIVIPQEMRSKLNFQSGMLLDIALEGEKVIISRPSSYCTLCGSGENLLDGIAVCRSCAEEIAAKLK